MNYLGKFKELRVLGAALAEIGAAIAIELGSEIFAPISDLQGNIISLIALDGSICASYQYSSFGEHSATTHKTWRFASKRLDESGLIYYGRRYYNPAEGRWTTPDPIGFGDGLNLYAFVKNNPLTHLDLYGLSAHNINPPSISPSPIQTPMIASPQIATKQIAAAPLPEAHIQSSALGSRAKSKLVGIGNGVVNFVAGSLHGLQTASFCAGIGEFGFSSGEISLMRQAISEVQSLAETQSAQINSINSWMTSAFSIDPFDPVYNSWRDKTTLGLEIGSIATGGWGIARSGITVFNKLSKVPAGAVKIADKLRKVNSQKINNAVGAVENFLGGKGKVITNADGDMILMQGNKKIRFDIRDSHGDKPHFHLEQRIQNGKWIDAGSEHRYYFTED